MAQKSPEPIPIDPEQWEIALKPFATDPDAAFDMARRLMTVKQFLQTKPPNLSLAKSSLDEACELLFPFTDFRKVAYELYLAFIDGEPTKAQEDILESLGIRY